MKPKILFVDDIQDILRGLKRMLHSKRREWDVHFALGGEEALEFLEKNDVNIVVSDMRMPKMDGAQLLAKVKEMYPDTVRFILSGHSEWAKISKAMGSMHQFLSKPCKADELISTLSNALSAQKLFTNKELKEIVTNMKALPSLPSLYAELMMELQDSYVAMDKVGGIISKDTGMVTKILQLVNSAFYGIVQEVTNINQATNILGLDTIKSLALALNVFHQLDLSGESKSFNNFLWNHGITTAEYAKIIAKIESKDKHVADNAFLTGLLHDSGKIILQNNMPEKYAQVKQTSQENDTPIYLVEKDVFGVTHSEVAAYVFSLWGIPSSTVAAIQFHHTPMESKDNTFGVLTALHGANALFYELEELGNASEIHPMCMEYLESLGLQDRLPIWKEACQELLVAGK